MSTDRDTSRLVRSWLEEGVTALPDRVLDAVLDQVPATHQRRSWWPTRRFTDMSIYTKLAAAALAVVVVAVIGYQLIPSRPGGNGGLPTTAPSATPSPTVAPSASPTPIPYSIAPATGLLTPGSVVLDGAFPLTIAFDVPAGWSRQGSTELADLVSVHKVRGDRSPTWASWAIVANVYRDPCHSASGPANPPVGPTVDNLVTALTTMVGFHATTPTDVTVAGYSGKRFQLSDTIDPATAGCDDTTWLSLWEPASGGATAQVPGATTMQFWVLDVHGTRLVMFTEAYDATAQEIAESVQVLESSRFLP